MNELTRTPSAPDELKSLLTPPASQGSAVLNEDGIDARSWWQLNTTEQAARMDMHDRAWWTRYRLAKAANALRTGIIRATEGLL